MKMIRSFLLGIALLALALPSGSFAQTPSVTTNRSVVIAAGNTFQVILAPGRWRSLTIQNNNSVDSCWIAFGNTITAANATKAESILLAAAQSYTRYYPYIPNDEIEGTCTNTSDTIYVDTQ